MWCFCRILDVFDIGVEPMQESVLCPRTEDTALVDAIRIGGTREAKIADAMLREWIL